MRTHRKTWKLWKLRVIKMPDSLETICFPRSFLCFDLLLVLKLGKKASLCKFHWPLDLCTFCLRGREVGLSVVASSPFRSPDHTLPAPPLTRERSNSLTHSNSNHTLKYSRKKELWNCYIVKIFSFRIWCNYKKIPFFVSNHVSIS